MIIFVIRLKNEKIKSNLIGVKLEFVKLAIIFVIKIYLL